MPGGYAALRQTADDVVPAGTGLEIMAASGRSGGGGAVLERIGSFLACNLKRVKHRSSRSRLGMKRGGTERGFVDVLVLLLALGSVCLGHTVRPAAVQHRRGTIFEPRLDRRGAAKRFTSRLVPPACWFSRVKTEQRLPAAFAAAGSF